MSQNIAYYEVIRKLLELRVDMSAFAERETFHESDEKSRPEAVLLQEMFPGLHIDLLVDILRYNNWNVEAGMDAALAWTAAKENSDDRTARGGGSTSNNVSSQIWRNQEAETSSERSQESAAGGGGWFGQDTSSVYVQPHSYQESISSMLLPHVPTTMTIINDQEHGNQVPRILLSQNFLVHIPT